MSGFVGIVSRSPDRPVADSEIRGLAGDYLALRPEAHQQEVGGGRARAVRFGRSSGEPGVERSDRGWALWSGTIYHHRPLFDPHLRELDGQFALMAHDADHDRVVVAADPFGMHALYTAERDDRTYVSTSALALARFLAARPDRMGVATFLRMGTQFGGLTHWEDIERLEPATFLRIGGDGVAVRDRYWRPELDAGIAALPFERAVGHALDVLIEPFARRLAGRPGICSDLTGGFDTRLLNLLLERAGVDFEANIRDEERLDIKHADEVARVSGWHVRHLGLPADWPALLPAMVPIALAWGDGALEVLELSWVLWAHRQIGETHPSLLSAGGGEHFQYAGWKSEFLNAGRRTAPNLDNFVGMRLLRPVDTRVFAVDPTEEVRAEALRRIAGWLEPYRTELNTTQLDIAYAYKSTGHFGAYRSADDGFVAAELPFYWKEGFVSAFSTNFRFRNNHRLMRHMIERLDPRAAAVTTTKGGTAQPWRATNLHRFLPYYGTLARKAVNKLAGKSGRSILPTVAHFDPASLEARRSILAALGDGRPLRHRDLRSGALFDPRAIDDFLRRAGQDEAFDIVLLGRILTVELALRAVDADLEP